MFLLIDGIDSVRHTDTNNAVVDLFDGCYCYDDQTTFHGKPNAEN